MLALPGFKIGWMGITGDPEIVRGVRDHLGAAREAGLLLVVGRHGAAEASEPLLDGLERRLDQKIKIVKDEHHIDDPEFAVRVGELIVELMKEKSN